MATDQAGYHKQTLIGVIRLQRHEAKAAAFKEQRESESDAPCVLGDASLCRKAASQRSVRSSTNPIPLTASIYSDEPDTDGRNFRFSER